MPACIIYAQSFSTISSVIPSFCKRGDIIVADKAVNFPVRKGIQISRSTVRWYEHNDMNDLEKVLQRVIKEQAGKPLTRRFIITEGLFENMGDIVDLPKIIELKLKYKFRLILDESWSYGVLGRTGRGVTEAQNVDATEVDMIVGSLSGPLCAAGGFCAGNEEVVEHQRISSASYTYSAALPALLSTTASETIALLQEQPEILTSLRERIEAMRAQLDPRSDWVRCSSSVDNPLMLLVLKDEVVAAKNLTIEDQNQILREVVDEVCNPRMSIIHRGKLIDLVSCKRCSDHTTESFPVRTGCQPKRCWLAASACSQGVCYQWTDEEGDRKGWCYHKTCHHQDHLTEEVGRLTCHEND